MIDVNASPGRLTSASALRHPSRSPSWIDLSEKTGSELHVVLVGAQVLPYIAEPGGLYLGADSSGFADLQRAKQSAQQRLDEQVGQIEGTGGGG